jgi:hypothetical protein
VLRVPDLGLVVAGDAVTTASTSSVASRSAAAARLGAPIDTVESLRPRWVVASHKNKDLDDDADRVIAQTRQYHDDTNELLQENSTALAFFNAMLAGCPERRATAR